MIDKTNALIFTGQLRGFQHCIDSIYENIIKPLNITKIVFCIPEEDKGDLTGFTLDNIGITVHAERDKFHDLEVIPSLGSLTTTGPIMEQNGYKDRGKLQHYFLQLYSKYKGFKVLEKSGIYKNVCMMRPDLKIEKRINFNIKQNTIYVPSVENYGGCYDRFCLGDFNTVKTYSLLYKNTHKNIGSSNDNAERRLLSWLEYNNINFNNTLYHFDKNIPRYWSDGKFRL